MGRFEELLEKAREGDTSAIDTLQQEFGASTLREKAENAEKYQKAAETNLNLAIDGQIGRLRNELPEELRGMDLSAGDFGDVTDPTELTIERLTEKAESKQASSTRAKEAQAKELGFDSVEDLQQALDIAKQAKSERKEGMEKIAGAASSSGTAPPPSGEGEPFEHMKESFDAAKARGRSDDRAMGEGVEALMAAQAPAEE
jgi:hypothetical protein